MKRKMRKMRKMSKKKVKKKVKKGKEEEEETKGNDNEMKMKRPDMASQSDGRHGGHSCVTQQK